MLSHSSNYRSHKNQNQDYFAMAEGLLEVIARVFGKIISSKLTVFILFLNTHKRKIKKTHYKHTIKFKSNHQQLLVLAWLTIFFLTGLN